MSLFLAAIESSLAPEFHVPGVQLRGSGKKREQEKTS